MSAAAKISTVLLVDDDIHNQKIFETVLRHSGFRAFVGTYALAMMADNVEHVISYWVLYQKFHSPALAGITRKGHA